MKVVKLFKTGETRNEARIKRDLVREFRKAMRENPESFCLTYSTRKGMDFRVSFSGTVSEAVGQLERAKFALMKEMDR